MVKIKTEWKSEEKLPDEAHLKALWEAEIRYEEGSGSASPELLKRRRANLKPLIESSGINTDDQLKKAKSQSKNFLKDIEPELVKPPVDIEAMHEQDVKLAQANEELKEGPGNPSWSGYIWSPIYGGYWTSYAGEAEEIPSAVINTASERIDLRAQSWGEGDGLFHFDYSKIDAYLMFRFTPPSWGHLHIIVYPWLHGYYSLYSDDDWWKWEEARTEVDTWVRPYQNFWRSPDYRRRLNLVGQEFHPTKYGRVDNSYYHPYYTDVGQGDPVYIQVGVRLYCQTRAGGSHAILNFQAGAANYVYIPYVYWYLHH